MATRRRISPKGSSAHISRAVLTLHRQHYSGAAKVKRPCGTRRVRWLFSILMAAFPLVCSSGTPPVSPVFVKYAGGEGEGGGGVSRLGIPKTVIAVTLSRTCVTAIKADRRRLPCQGVRRACRRTTSSLNGPVADGDPAEEISQLSH